MDDKTSNPKANLSRLLFGQLRFDLFDAVILFALLIINLKLNATDFDSTEISTIAYCGGEAIGWLTFRGLLNQVKAGIRKRLEE